LQNNKKPLFRSPGIFGRIPGLISAESTRHGGVSVSPYASLNLGGATQDPANVSENNRRFFSALNIPFEQVAKSHQIHEAEILSVTQPGRFEGYDALMTNQQGVYLAVTVADCTPVLICDPVKRAVAAVHAGWRGTVKNIVSKTLAAMQKEFGTHPADCYGYVGTCIDECSFEVGEEVALHFSSPHKRWDAVRQKFFIDLKQANKDQLLAAGLNASNIEISPYSTVLNNDDYFSYRLEKGVTGRMLATIGFAE
jgi:YfiH family protein